MIGRGCGSWFTPEARASSSYTDALLSAQLAAAQGVGSVRGSAVYQACLNLISDAAATAELTGDHSEVLQPRLGAIARSDGGHRRQAAFELVVGRAGRLELLPVEITNVSRPGRRGFMGLHHHEDGTRLYGLHRTRANRRTQFSDRVLPPGPHGAVSLLFRHPALRQSCLSKMELQLTS